MSTTAVCLPSSAAQLLESILMALAIITCGQGVHGKPINSMVGPYIAYVERFYNCDPENRTLPWRWYLRGSHFNPFKPKEFQRLTGNITLTNATFDDSCSMKIILDLRSNNQWKENAFVFNFRKNACRVFKENNPTLYEVVYKKRESNGACILKPGVYELNNASVDWTFPNVPILPYGRYRLRSMTGKADDLYSCWAADCRAVPKSD
ncbi:uncharacterized protein LOC127749182 [Frankliniella occidentalis]|uniref:Uncharacterized protein LOC127749182 n=1 Tax=Frankliniella occidentalis TaxID=133901 RepID=A0A9C6TXW0_FRAOC|nr:uncharacterized protein LOC127749182 [Frankliniella occidentalis]